MMNTRFSLNPCALSFVRNIRRKTDRCCTRKSLVLFMLLCCCIAFCGPAFADSHHKRNILILHSYHPGYKWTDDETRGILDGLESVKDTTKIYIEYMGTKWANSDSYFDSLLTTYREKYRDIRFAVLFVTDNDAFDFVRTHRDSVFGKVPVVFCGVNWFRDEDLKGQTLFTGVNEDADIAATLDVMLALHPKTTSVLAVMDSTTTGRIMRTKILELEPQYRGKIAFRILQDMDMAEILKTVAAAPENSLVLLTVFQKDRAGVFFEYGESTSLLSKKSRVPVYGLWDFNLGFGIVGGKLTSGYAQGSSAATLGLRILQGESADAIPVIKKSPNKYLFDFEQLSRFNLSKTGLPDGSEIINEPPSFYAVNKTLLWSLLGGILLLSSIVVVLGINIQQRRKAQAELQQAHDELEQRVHDRTADLVRVNELLQQENSERTKAEAEVRTLNAELCEFNQEIENLVSERTMNLMALAVAYRVRNPVTVIGATSRRIIEKSTSCQGLSPALQEQLGILSESAAQLEQIVADFQSLLSSRQTVFHHLDINEAIESVLHLMRREAETREIELVTDLHEQPLMINAQINLLKIALFHLIRNALEATPRRGKVRIATMREGEKVILIVHDSGQGIPQDTIGKIFEPFYSTKNRSFGMGLPLVRQVVAEHMGDIHVESEVGAGSTFRITFPTRWKER